MKIKSKLILAATSLLVLSGVAAGTSTFAWYTANRQVTLGVTSITAQSAATGMDIAYVSGTRDTLIDPVTVTPTSNETSKNVDVQYTNALTDVSGYGKPSEFVKPMFGPKDQDATTDVVGWWADEKAYQTDYATTSWYHSVELGFSTTGSDTGSIGLYLDSKPETTYISEADAASDALTTANNVRFAALDDLGDAMFYGNVNGNSVEYWTNESEVATVKDAEADAKVTTLTDDNFFGDPNIGASNLFRGVESNVPAGKTFYSDPSTGYLGTLTSSATVNITFIIWVEGVGAEADNLTNDITGAFDIGLGFHTVDLSVLEETA